MSDDTDTDTEIDTEALPPHIQAILDESAAVSRQGMLASALHAARKPAPAPAPETDPQPEN